MYDTNWPDMIRRRAGRLFPMALGESVGRFLDRLGIRSWVPLVLDDLFARATAAGELDPASVQADAVIQRTDAAATASASSFLLAAARVEMLADCEDIAGLLETGEAPRMRVRAIRDWAELLRFWDVNARGVQIEEGVVRLGVDRSYRINDRAVSLLGNLVGAPWEVPRINQLQGGVLDPHRFSSRRGPDAEVRWDPRLLIAVEVAEEYGWSAPTALDLAEQWLEGGVSASPDARLDGTVTGCGAYGAFLAARDVWRALAGPGGRYHDHVMLEDEMRSEPLIRFELVGEMLRIPTRSMAQRGLVSPAEPTLARDRRIHEVGILVSNLHPTLPHGIDETEAVPGMVSGATFSLAAELRRTAAGWYADPDEAPVQVTAIAPRNCTGTRVDFLVDVPATPSSHAGVIHMWFQEVRNPQEWDIRRMLLTSSPEWSAVAMEQALRRGLLLTPSALLYGPWAGEMAFYRVPSTRSEELIPAHPVAREARDLLQPDVIPPRERIVMELLGLRPQAAFERWIDEPQVIR